MLSPSQIKSNVLTRSFNYKNLVKNSKIIKNIVGGNADINFYIPVRGRVNFFKPFIKYAKAASENTRGTVNYIIIENDTISNYKSLCEKENISYIFIPNELTQSDNIFAKALCYNLGFVCANIAKWNIFHDLDILIDNNYFNNLYTYLIKKDITWIQPYAKKRVVMLGKSATDNIIKTDLVLDFNNVPDKKESMAGCPGGSIVVRREDFISIGGYDPELFFGYSPEDSFFWTKLEILYGAPDTKYKTHFQGKAIYADSPPIDVFHMYHENALSHNKYYYFMLETLHSFWEFKNKERKEIIELKSKLFKESLP
jgi:hypothetical protein